jgi:predicted alpha/beta superfamily hydrolase
MGALISLYAVLQYPKVFCAVGAFYTSFWITDSKIFRDIKKKGRKVSSFIYLYGGKKEGSDMVTNILKASEVMPSKSNSKLVTMIRDEGEHNERRWRLEFPLFYQQVIGSIR